ncbi:aminotransferase class V-fold PLP-dependent enzyme [Agromyces sp. MMS17-SY077]|uniref:Aminotransferase class V-fold PLP-dependent enzyme n=1 Tax=Agromyces seonyuensis TaxID=2662446 RepID=A0A6I4P564_9MICO|nr:aminotransferase class V-fold PLP-dependent enzyme [Agromyces seonyuensis]
MPFAASTDDVLAELSALRAHDAPTHGGRVLSYVYDSGLAELDDLAASAARLVQPVNGLDPTTFVSVAALEGDVVGFARTVFHGDEDVVGSVTSGGTESCLLAVKTARDAWRAEGGDGTPRLVAPSTVHAAFHKAAEYFGLELDLVPVDPATGAPAIADVAARLGDDVALLVASAPSYPFATLDPVQEFAALALEHGVPLHVDACIGGFALAFDAGWTVGARADGELLPAWDFAVPGVTSLSADLHKYGYAPKGVSVLLHRGRDRQRRQWFATTAWPGYPVVNPTLVGSKPAGPLAAAWAIIRRLGVDGFDALSRRTAEATAVLVETVRGIDGLVVVGEPVGPLFAVAADETVAPERRIDPHHWADAVGAHGFKVQLQPGLVQADGRRLPHTAHLTITPATAGVLDELVAALVAGADAARGAASIDAGAVLAGLGADPAAGAAVGALLANPEAAAALTSEQAAGILGALGLAGADGPALPDSLAPVLALVEALPGELVERLLIELLARVVEPR